MQTQQHTNGSTPKRRAKRDAQTKLALPAPPDHDDAEHRIRAITSAYTELKLAEAKKKVAAKEVDEKRSKLEVLLGHTEDTRQAKIPFSKGTATTPAPSPAAPVMVTVLDAKGGDRQVRFDIAENLRAVIARGFPHQFISGFGVKEPNVELVAVKGEPVTGIDEEGRKHAVPAAQITEMMDAIWHKKAHTLVVAGGKGQVRLVGFLGGRRIWPDVAYNERGNAIGITDKGAEIDVPDESVEAVIDGRGYMAGDGDIIEKMKPRALGPSDEPLVPAGDEHKAPGRKPRAGMKRGRARKGG